MLLALERLFAVSVLILIAVAIIFCIYVGFDIRRRILKQKYNPGFNLSIEKLKYEFIELNRLIDG